MSKFKMYHVECIRLTDLLKDFPTAMIMFNDTDLPFTFGDCEYSLVTVQTIHEAIQCDLEAEVKEKFYQFCLEIGWKTLVDVER